MQPQGTLLMPLSGGSVDLAPVDGFSATLIFPRDDGAAASPTVAYLSTGDPVAAASSTRSPLSTNVPRTAVVYYYYKPQTTQHLSGLPGGTVTLSNSDPTTGVQYLVAFYDGSKYNYGVEGPGTISGHKVTFSGTHTPVTLYAGVTYALEVYYQPIVYPLQTSPTPLSLNVGQSKNFTASEQNYTGPFSASTCTQNGKKIASVSAMGGKNGPSATGTVTGVAAGSCTITVSDSYGQTASENVTVGSGTQPLSVNPNSLTLDGNQSSSFTVSESGFSGNFSIGTCTLNGQPGGQTIANVSPSSVPGPSGMVNVSAASGGSCTIAVSDGNGQTTDVSVTVNTSAIQLNPSALMFATVAGAPPQSIAVSEANYTGQFTVTPCAQNGTTVATLDPSSAAGPNASFTATAQADGICTVMVSDSLDQSTTFQISVTSAVFNINAKQRR